MSSKSEFPEESSSEEKILELLKQSSSGSGADREARLIYLDKLRRRALKRVDEVMEILLPMMKQQGMSRPESSLIIELLSKLANSEETAFQKLLDSMISVQNPQLYSFAMIVRNLDDVEKKRISAKRLLSLLMNCDSFSNVTDEMYTTLVTMENEQICRDIVQATLPYLNVVDPLKIVYAVKIFSRLASPELSSELEFVIERALIGWYNAYKEEILNNICSYYTRTKDVSSIPHLLQILKSDFNREGVGSKALASVVDAHPKAITIIWEFLEKQKEHYLPILMAFEEMKTSIDVERLISTVEIDWGKWAPMASLKNIMIKSGNQARPVLLEMIKDRDEVRYTFARDCLEEIGISIEEYSKVFKKPPILQVFEFFYKQRQEMFLENLWEKQDRLGESIKHSQIGRFEYFVQNFFSTLGFVTMFVDPSGREGVDLVVFSSDKPYILVIGCTTSILKTDLEKLNMTLNEMKDALKELFAKYRIIPMVFTSRKVEVHPTDSEYAGKNGVAILTHKEITILLKMLKTNRGKNDEIIKFIKQSIPLVSITP